MPTDNLSNKKPLISIGITCFNAESTIGRAIDSALSQSWSSFEVIVVDDLSTDRSCAVIEEYVAQDSRIKLVKRANNGGPAASRNTIIDAAKGDYIVFFDDDDESYPNRVRIQYEAIENYKVNNGNELIACFASGKRRYSNDYELNMPAIGSQPSPPTGSQVVDYLLFNGRSNGVFYGAGTPTCAMMASTATFIELGGFDEALRRVEDVDFCIRLGLKGGVFIGCPQSLFLQHATVSEDKTPEINFDSENKLLEKHKSYLLSKGRYNYSLRWFNVRYCHFSGKRFKFFFSLCTFLMRYPLRGGRHIIRSIPQRWLHERKMRVYKSK